MADFDAGSIEGTLDLDTDPFVRGLLEAKARAKEFESRTLTKTVKVDEKTTGAKAPVDQEAKLGLDDSEFDRKLGEDETKLAIIGKRKAKPKVEVDTSQSSAALAALNRHIDNVAGKYKSAAPGMPGSGHGLAMLIGLAAALAPAFGPATAAVGLFSAAGIAGFGGAAISLGLYAKVLSGTIKKIQDANKAGKELPGWLGKAQKAMKGLSDAWDALQKKTAPGQARLLIAVFTTLQSVLPKLVPLINAISKGLLGAFAPIQHLMESGLMDRFIKLLSANAIKDLPQIGKALANGLGGLMNLFIALNPIIQRIVSWLPKITHEFDRWARVKAPTFINDLFASIQKYGPQTLKMFQSLGDFLLNVGKAMAPLTGPALDVLTHIADALSKIDFQPLTRGIGDVMDKLAPFADVIGTLVNILLPPLGAILQTIGDDFVGPLGQSLAERLTPALQALGDVLNFIAPYLGDIINSFADLVNPTGVAFFTKLITALAPVVKDLVPPLSRLVVAIEGMVDAGLQTLTPFIGPLAGALDGLVKAITPLIDGLAWFLSHKAVADTILGIAAAIKAITITSAMVSSLSAFIGVLRTIAALSAAEGIMAGIAAVSPGLAAGLTAVGVAFDFMLGPIGLIILAIAAFAIAAYEIHKHWDKIGPWLHGMWEGIKHTFQAAVSWIGGKLSDLKSTIASKIQGVLSWVKSHWLILAIFIAPFIALPALIATHWSRVQAFLSRIPGIVGRIFSNAAHWLLGAGRGIIAGLASGISDRWSSLVGWLGALGGRIVGAIGDTGHLLWSAGWNVVKGLADGIASAISKLNPVGKIAGLMGAIAGHGPHSPAKYGPFSGAGWARWTDGGIIKGLAAGMRRATPEAVKAAAGAMDDIHAALNGKMGDTMLSLNTQANSSLATQVQTLITTLTTALAEQGLSESQSLAAINASISTLRSTLASLMGAQNGVITAAAAANARAVITAERQNAHAIITKIRAA